MNKQLLLAAAMSICIAGEATAACDDPLVVGANLTNLIVGNTVCASLGSDRWQEQHRAGGELWDYKLGPNDPIDPTKRVGSWEIRAEGREFFLRHIYASGSYNYEVRGSGNIGDLHSLCGSFDGGVDILNAQILPGAVACP